MSVTPIDISTRQPEGDHQDAPAGDTAGGSESGSRSGGSETGNSKPGESGAGSRAGGSDAGQSAVGRSLAEWVTLALSSLVVLGLVALTSYLFVMGPTDPAALSVEPRLGEVYQSGARFYLPVTVTNTGGQTAEEARVRVTLTDAAGRTESSEFQVQFLAGGGASRAVASFGIDPRAGQLDASVMSFLKP